MDEIVTSHSLDLALQHLQALKRMIPPRSRDLADLAEQAQRAVLELTLRGIDDANRHAMMLAALDVWENEDGSMSIVDIFRI